MTSLSSRRQTRPIRRMAIPSPHLVDGPDESFKSLFLTGALITSMLVSVLLGAAILLGALWLVLWIARQVVELLA